MRRKTRRTKIRRSSPIRKVRRRKTTSVIKIFQPASIGYGIIRQPISNQVTKLFSNIPVLNQFSQYIDNVAMASFSYLLAKNGSGIIKDIGIRGLTAENVLLGADIGNQFINNRQNGNSIHIN